MSKANKVICMYIVSNLKIEKKNKNKKQGQTLRKGRLSMVSKIFYGPQEVSEGQN